LNSGLDNNVPIIDGRIAWWPGYDAIGVGGQEHFPGNFSRLNKTKTISINLSHNQNKINFLNPRSTNTFASQDPIAVILMVAITIIIAALLLLMLIWLPSFTDDRVPDIFRIQSVKHTDDHGVLNNNGYVVLVNAGSADYINYLLFARTYVNGNEKEIISSLNDNQFIPSHHFDVKNMGGLGADGSPTNSLSRWYRSQTIWIDYKNGLIHPGDTLMIEVYNKSSGAIISRDTWPRSDPRSETDWWVAEFTHPGT